MGGMPMLRDWGGEKPCGDGKLGIYYSGVGVYNPLF